MLEVIFPPDGVSTINNSITLQVRSFDEDAGEPVILDVYLNGEYVDSYVTDSDGYTSVTITLKERDNVILLENDIGDETEWFCTYTNASVPPNISSVLISPNPVNTRAVFKVVVEVS